MTAGVVRWGVLGAARIALHRVIPGMQQSTTSRVVAIASRDAAKARAAAHALGIDRAYGSYDELLADDDIDVVYIPLPNHLHVPWSLRAADAGRHVLCEKPIALTAAEAEELRAARDRSGVLIGEAFMVRTHPQWLAVRDMVRTGSIGALRLITCHFSYAKLDPDNIRNRLEWGGGALMDIGCYAVTLSRWLFAAEPTAVVAQMERDPQLRIDRLTSGVLRFDRGQATFTCATQLVPYQRVHVYGTTGRIEVEVPLNAPADEPCRIVIDRGADLHGRDADVVEFPAIDQFAAQADAFAAAVRGQGGVPVPLDDAIANMRVLDALFRSASSGSWCAVAAGAGS